MFLTIFLLYLLFLHNNSNPRAPNLENVNFIEAGLRQKLLQCVTCDNSGCSILSSIPGDEKHRLVTGKNKSSFGNSGLISVKFQAKPSCPFHREQSIVDYPVPGSGGL